MIYSNTFVCVKKRIYLIAAFWSVVLTIWYCNLLKYINSKYLSFKLKLDAAQFFVLFCLCNVPFAFFLNFTFGLRS